MKETLHLGVVGTGLIGAGMATLLIGNGIPTVLWGIDDQNRAAGKAAIELNFKDLVEKELMTEAQVKRSLNLLKITGDYGDMSSCDIVFEAVLEKEEIKRAVYKNLEEHCRKDMIIASVTSAMAPSVLAEMVVDKSRILVAHPFNPPHIVPLVELSRSPYTSDIAVERVKQLLEYCGKAVVVLNKEVEGFIVNRLQHAMTREALYLVEEGVCSAQDINKAIYYSIGQRYSSIGLFEHYDAAGLPLQLQVQGTIFPTLCNSKEVQNILKGNLEQGNLGITSGRGILDWSNVDMDDFRKRQTAPFYPFFNYKLTDDI